MKLVAMLSAVAATLPPPPIAAVNSPLNDYNISFDAAEQTMVFARSEAEFRKARIYVASRKEDAWDRPIPISFSDDRYVDSDPWLTPDGNTLYFISDRPAASREAGRTDYDIWRSTRTTKGWSTPEHLGTEVNGRGPELGPELHGDTLYFASARRTGAGGLDIYRARIVGQTFEQATLLDGSFNTAASESDFTLSEDGTTAMFWRSNADLANIHISYRGPNGWSEPASLPATINIGPFNFTPSFSSNGRVIRYASTREREGQAKGLADIYEAELPPR